MVGHNPVLQPQGEDGKRARYWDHLLNVVLVVVVGLQGQPAEGFALVQQPQGQDERKAKAGTTRQKVLEAHAMAQITLDLEAAGRPCGEKTKGTKK